MLFKNITLQRIKTKSVAYRRCFNTKEAEQLTQRFCFETTEAVQ